MVTFTATNAACRKMTIYAAVPVPLAVVTLLGSGSGLKSGHFYPEVKERVYLVDFLIFYYLEDFDKEGISGYVSAGGEERSNRVYSEVQMFKGVSNRRDGNISRDADDLDLEFPLLRQGVGVVSVSYTHLDVYKRQEQAGRSCTRGTERGQGQILEVCLRRLVGRMSTTHRRIP